MDSLRSFTTQPNRHRSIPTETLHLEACGSSPCRVPCSRSAPKAAARAIAETSDEVPFDILVLICMAAWQRDAKAPLKVTPSATNGFGMASEISRRCSFACGAFRLWCGVSIVRCSSALPSGLGLRRCHGRCTPHLPLPSRGLPLRVPPLKGPFKACALKGTPVTGPFP